MEKLTGKGVSAGIAIGKVFTYKKKTDVVSMSTVSDIPEELRKFAVARQEAKNELIELYARAYKKFGISNAKIFEAHQILVDDPDFIETVESMIKHDMVNAEFAVSQVGEKIAADFEILDDEFMKSRSEDIRDVTKRIVRKILGESDYVETQKDPVIVVAEELSPSETIQMDKEKVIAFVTKKGSANSHTAILAKSMNVPAIIDVHTDDVDGKIAIVDGDTGVFIVEPTDELIAAYKERKDIEYEKTKALESLVGKENITTDGRRIDLFANISDVTDVKDVLDNDAGGIGLFRSEFLYLKTDKLPTEEEQFLAYKEVAEKMNGKEVVIRTLDIGADKKADYLGLEKEENPAMGFRAIRICLKRREMFKTQLRAIFRASVFGNISVLYPMITSEREVRLILEIVNEVKNELCLDGITFGKVRQGIMIETPAAAIISEELARLVDFLSIGTNDLTQYTLAIDRENHSLDDFYDAHHPAVMSLIEMTVKNGHKSGCKVGICGELAGDRELTSVFVDMGVDELSVSPSQILPLREIIRNM